MRFSILTLTLIVSFTRYVWIGGSGLDLRSKTRTIRDVKGPVTLADLPVWNFDGSSTGQAPGEDSEVFLKPAAVFKDPFRGGGNVLVMCETWLPPYISDSGVVTETAPHPSNTRNPARIIFDKAAAHETWYDIQHIEPYSFIVCILLYHFMSY